MGVRAALTCVLVLLAGCGESTSTDPRFATPERTVETLLAAHGAGDASEAELQRRIASEGGLVLVDRELYTRCFVDLDQPGGASMASYVLGMLAAARDALRYETIGEHGYVIPREGMRIAMQRGEDGAYRIVLADSVPEEVRRSVIELEGSAPRAPSERP